MTLHMFAQFGVCESEKFENDMLSSNILPIDKTSLYWFLPKEIIVLILSSIDFIC